MTTGRDRRVDASALVPSSSDALIARLVACLPAATFEMETLCHLAGIKVSRVVQSAAVEHSFRPRLLLNPDFVASYCFRDEHLFLLVMHELWHVILAHTRLYPRATLAHNIAFDAVINSGLARQFNAPEFRGFFEAVNPADSFPGCLLRPPEGWPGNPQYRELDPPGTRALVERLYPLHNRGRWSQPLYEELLDLLRGWIKTQALDGRAEDDLLLDGAVLIGDHGGGDALALDDPFFSDVLQRVVEAWPPPPFEVGSRAGGRGVGDLALDAGDVSEATRRTFAAVLRRCLNRQAGRFSRRARQPVAGVMGLHVLPNPHDRLAAARTRLGVQGVLWNQPGVVAARSPEAPSRAYIYLDVSGSMREMLPYLISLLLPYVARGEAFVYQFSTLVEPLPFEPLKRGKLRSTRGTDINSVLAHLLGASPLVPRALILTDGRTGVPLPEHVRTIKARKVQLHVVLPSGAQQVEDLQGIARSITILPEIKPHRKA